MLFALLALVAPQPVVVGAPPMSVAPTVEATTIRVPKGTQVTIRLGKPVSSAIAIPGEHFPISLLQPVVGNDGVLLPAGLRGEGEVIHAAKARWGGKAGEIIVNARYLMCGATRIPLGKMKVGGTGENRVDTALIATMVAFPLGFVVNGGNIVLPENATFVATVTADTQISGGGCVTPVPADPAPAVTTIISNPEGGVKP